MTAYGPTSPVHRLLSRIIGAYTSADQSSDSGEFAHNIELSRNIAEQLHDIARNDFGIFPDELEEFLQAARQTTENGQMPEDRELFGLVDWAHRLYEEYGHSGDTAQTESSSSLAAE